MKNWGNWEKRVLTTCTLSLKICDLTISDIIKNDQLCMKIFQDHGVLPTTDLEVECGECGQLASVTCDIKRPMGFLWRCRGRYGCNSSLSPFVDTFLLYLKRYIHLTLFLK